MRRSALLLLSFLGLAAATAMAPQTSEKWPVNHKTLVAWVTPSTLDQRGGSVLTIEKPGGIFDGIVFGELKPATWMAGSDNFKRTKQDQSTFPTEKQANAFVEIAI